jgi:aspartyl aminopeptidase
MDKNLKTKLQFQSKSACEFLSSAETEKADLYCEGYIDFLNAAKTERETIAAALVMAEKQGFVPWKKGMETKPGGKIYFNQRDKALILCRIGEKPLGEGISIIASHADSPRLDLKMKPVYEEEGICFLDTHYYGDIKSYQWTGIPLSLHGHIVCKDTRKIDIRIGEEKGDPCFFIADLLPHLGKTQMERPGSGVVKNEDLDLLAGLRFAPEETGEGAVKLNILRILYEEYGIGEADLVSAELEALPAFPARSLGLDKSMVGAYGQDDKVCVYPSLTALFSLRDQSYTACVLIADKEETGSLGATGMQSRFFENFINSLAPSGGDDTDGPAIFSNSLCISADVNTCMYPLYREVFDGHGEAKLNHGVILFRYWGRDGKENTNDADAETTAALRKILDEEGILWQTGEGGKVDAGSSGTISRFLANLGIPAIDLGVPVLSMHSPFEGAAKTDVYMAHRAFAAVFNRK